MSAPDLRLLLSNRPQNVALVRQALGGLAGAVGLDDGLLADVKTAVSEAWDHQFIHLVVLVATLVLFVFVRRGD